MPGTETTPTDPTLEPSWKQRSTVVSKRRRAMLWSGLVFIVGAAVLAFMMFRPVEKIERKKERAISVNVAVATVRQLPLEVRSIGNVTAYSVVNITPQVSGQLQKVFFQQGQFVHKGDLLFQIDPRPYEAAVAQVLGTIAKDNAQIAAAEANLARDQAQVGQMRANMERDQAQAKFANVQKYRYGMLAKEGAISQESSDQVNSGEAQATASVQSDRKAIENAQAVTEADKALIQTAKASVKSDDGILANAKLQLQWTKIFAPIDGRTSSFNVNAGNIVAANSPTPIVSLMQVSPIYVTASVPEQYLNEIRRTKQALHMQALVEGQRTDSVGGTISFMENTVNVNTGTIALRGTFENKDDHLYPGQFVDVVITLPPTGDTVVIPSRAIQTSQKGQAVYVVSKNNTVELRPVKVGRIFGEEAALTDGLSRGETVVTDGQLQLVPGTKIVVQSDQKRSSRRR